MFLNNKYKKWYDLIVKRAGNRLLEGYYEIHHILPKSLGGNDLNNNLVKLTAREHFICHLLLTKMVEGNNKYKMIKAAKIMSVGHSTGQQRYKVTNRIYSLLKENVEVPMEVKLKMRESQRNRFKNSSGTFLGKKHSEDTRKKMSLAASKPKSDKWKASASKNRIGRTAPNKGISHTEDVKQKIRLAMLGEKNPFFGKRHTEEQRQKKREEKLAAPKKICYYCNKEIDPMNYARWHGDKCKSKK